MVNWAGVRNIGLDLYQVFSEVNRDLDLKPLFQGRQSDEQLARQKDSNATWIRKYGIGTIATSYRPGSANVISCFASSK
jgi:hypothetical protein